jgi:methionine sulfoxide reductase heme-binding subunit
MTSWPWMEAPGRFSLFKLAVFLALFAPGIWTAGNFALGLLGPRPLTEAIHQVGLWSIRFLFLSLTITPARHLLQWPRLLLVRRMVGVAAFAYIFIHLCLYAVDEGLLPLHIAAEIVLRIYLTIGFTALVGLGVLAATSTDGMVRALGSRRWQRLHNLIHPIALLAIIHMFMQSKADVWEVTWMAGIYGWLGGYRLLARRYRGGRVPLPWAALLAVVAGLLTAAGEAIYFWLKMNVVPTRLLAVNLSLVAGVRPAWIVLISALALCLGGAIAYLWRWRRDQLTA